MSTELTRDRAPYVCEIVIPIAVKIPIYIKPTVLEVPSTCSVLPQEMPPQEMPPQETTDSALDSAPASSALELQNSSKLMSIKALSLVLLTSASAAACYLLRRLSLPWFRLA